MSYPTAMNNDYVQGLNDAVCTHISPTSHEWHELTKEWLRANRGTPEQLEAKRRLRDGLRKEEPEQ